MTVQRRALTIDALFAFEYLNVAKKSFIMQELADCAMEPLTRLINRHHKELFANDVRMFAQRIKNEGCSLELRDFVEAQKMVAGLKRNSMRRVEIINDAFVQSYLTYHDGDLVERERLKGIIIAAHKYIPFPAQVALLKYI